MRTARDRPFRKNAVVTEENWTIQTVGPVVNRNEFHNLFDAIAMVRHSDEDEFPMKFEKTILLNPSDNVVVLTGSLRAGERVVIAGCEYVLAAPLGLGHKLAVREISSGEKIIKYGVPIGSATCGIAAGGHVHLHNMQSDYLPTFTLEEGREFQSRAS